MSSGVEGKWAQLTDRLMAEQARADTAENELRELRARLAVLEGCDKAKVVEERDQLDARVRELLGGSDGWLRLDESEREAMEAVLRANEIIIRQWRLRVNAGELVAAVHTIQAFVQQHMLARLAPALWGNWWEQNDDVMKEVRSDGDDRSAGSSGDH